MSSPKNTVNVMSEPPSPDSKNPRKLQRAFEDEVDITPPAKIVRNHDALQYRSPDPSIRVLHVCQNTASADAFLYCKRNETGEQCVIPLHKEVLRRNVPYENGEKMIY